MAFVLLAIQSRTAPPHWTRTQMRAKGFAALRHEWEETAWVSAVDLVHSTGVPQTTVYRTLAKLKQEGAVNERVDVRRDALGRLRDYREYQIIWEWPKTDPDSSDVWLEVGGRKCPMVHEWQAASGPALPGWIAIRSKEEVEAATSNTRLIVSLFVGSRWAYRRGLKVGAGPYEGIMEGERWVVSPTKGNPEKISIKGDERLLAEVNHVLDAAEMGDEIVLHARVVVLGAHREQIHLSAGFRVDLDYVEEELARFQRGSTKP